MNTFTNTTTNAVAVSATGSADLPSESSNIQDLFGLIGDFDTMEWDEIAEMIEKIPASELPEVDSEEVVRTIEQYSEPEPEPIIETPEELAETQTTLTPKKRKNSGPLSPSPATKKPRSSSPSKKKSRSPSKGKNRRPSPSPSKKNRRLSPSKGKKLSLQEFHAEQERMSQKRLAALEADMERIKREEEVRKREQKQREREERKVLREQQRRKMEEQRKKEMRAKKKGWSSVGAAQQPKRKSKRKSQKEQRAFVNTTLILKNLPFYQTSEEDLRSICIRSGNGAIRFINVLRDEAGRCKGIAFIRFNTRMDSDRALRMLGQFRYQDRTVYAEYAMDKREK